MGRKDTTKPRTRRSGGRTTSTHASPRNVTVIGAGPSGLMAAVAAARAGAKVVVFDQLDRTGAKLRASGGGRGNLTNTLPEDEFIEWLSPRGRFALPALRALGADNLCSLLDEMGVPTQSLDGFHVYPVSNKAEDVLKALMDECARLGVNVRVSTRIVSLQSDGKGVTSVSDETTRYPAARVIVATGGLGYPRLGGTGDGYTLAQQAGHTMVAPVPALVGLVTVEDWPRSCAGVSLRDTRVWIDLPRWRRIHTEGGLIFTHEGVSGPAILDISGKVTRLLQERETVPLCVNLTPGISSSLWLDRIEGWQRREGGKAIQSLLARTIPRSFAAVVCGLAGLDHISRAAHLERAGRERLVEMLGGVPVTIRDSEGFGKAMITSGGISLKEINPKTMASRLVPGLFFCGEVVDLDGPSGGFNLQWAFSSGWLAGTSATQ